MRQPRPGESLDSLSAALLIKNDMTMMKATMTASQIVPSKGDYVPKLQLGRGGRPSPVIDQLRLPTTAMHMHWQTAVSRRLNSLSLYLFHSALDK